MSAPFQLFDLKQVADPRYLMIPVELKEYISFDVKRVYYISHPVQETGAHCHKAEEEFFILMQGTCTTVIDRGNGIERIPMKGPGQAVYIRNYVWHHFTDFSPDALLLALSSTNYNPTREDYIQNYEEYLKIRDQMLTPGQK